MSEVEGPKESSIGAILGWGGLAVFAIVFAWYIGAPLISGERWAEKKADAIEVVRNFKPTGKDTLYDMIRGYSLKAKEKDITVAEFKWDATQRDGPKYEVTLLWTEEGEKHVAVWLVNLQDKNVQPQGDEASGLPQRIEAGPTKKSAG